MKGSILDFSIQDNTGFITGDDNNRYSFSGADWRGQRPPSRGDRVDFIVNSTGHAVDIYLALGSSIHLGESISNQINKYSNLDQAEELQQYRLVRKMSNQLCKLFWSCTP